MKTKMMIINALLIVSFLHAYSQNESIHPTRKWRAFCEFDVPITVLTGGISMNSGIRYENYRLSLGYEHFDAPSKEFSGTPDGFKMRVDYIFALNLDYFFSKTKESKGLYSRFMYHTKSQFVENIETQDSKILYSQLVGAEIGYVWKFYRGLYIAHRLGALYYLQSPQGKGNNPLLIGNAYYDNPRHKVWDTYYSFVVGYTF
ncbi:MAG: hypothetical protein LLF95_11730 [Bacteroidales bacterium]|nr:hypothetical protein [Bacteroidales bacterium]